MLSDFLLLETYYDAPETCQTYEDMMKRYGLASILWAIKAGYITSQQKNCAAHNEKIIADLKKNFWLTEKGRALADSEPAA